MENILKKYGTEDIDYVIENKDGSIVNIQFNENGKKYKKEFKSSDDFLKTIDNRLTDYKDFYNKIESNEYNFIGYADGYSQSNFN